MKQFIKTDFDLFYEELNNIYAIDEGKAPTKYSSLNIVDETFNSTPINIDAITMDLPAEVKESYVNNINSLIQAEGRLRDYLDNQWKYHVHHINLRSLGGEKNDFNNLIIVSPKEHQKLHQQLAEALKQWIENSENFDKTIFDKNMALKIYCANNIMANYHKELEVAEADTGKESDLSSEELISLYYTTQKEQSLHALEKNGANLREPAAIWNYQAPMYNAKGENASKYCAFINFIVDAGKIIPDYEHPVITTISDAECNFLRKSSKNIRATINKNFTWIKRGFPPFNAITDTDTKHAWLALTIQDAKRAAELFGIDLKNQLELFNGKPISSRPTIRNNKNSKRVIGISMINFDKKIEADSIYQFGLLLYTGETKKKPETKRSTAHGWARQVRAVCHQNQQKIEYTKNIEDIEDFNYRKGYYIFFEDSFNSHGVAEKLKKIINNNNQTL